MEKNDIETMIEFLYNKCLRCDYVECIKRKERIEEYETSLQKLKNEKIHDLKNIMGIKF